MSGQLRDGGTPPLRLEFWLFPVTSLGGCWAGRGSSHETCALQEKACSERSTVREKKAVRRETHVSELVASSQVSTSRSDNTKYVRHSVDNADSVAQVQGLRLTVQLRTTAQATLLGSPDVGAPSLRQPSESLGSSEEPVMDTDLGVELVPSLPQPSESLGLSEEAVMDTDLGVELVPSLPQPSESLGLSEESAMDTQLGVELVPSLARLSESLGSSEEPVMATQLGLKRRFASL